VGMQSSIISNWEEFCWAATLQLLPHPSDVARHQP
jgi:hypothetical protein